MLPTMPTAVNPILPGFHPDPSICRVGDDYYLATSTFEWWPGVRIHHSRDLVHWRLAAEPLTRRSQLDLAGIPDSGGIWAPCLSHAHGLFWLVYTPVTHLGGPFKDTPNLVVSATSIEGPWSEPAYLNSTGFDPSLFHDDDGRSWLVTMRWDHRQGRNRFDGIILTEFDWEARRLVGEPVRITGGSGLGCTEGPHLYRHDGWYWLLLAEGGTGPNHAAVMGRSRSLAGPYEFDPAGPLLTSRDAWDHPLQKAGHGSLVHTPDGWFLAHLTARPDRPLGRCRLGRETALQRIAWPAGGWPRLAHGGVLPATEVAVGLPAHPWPSAPDATDFPGPGLPPHFNSLREPPEPAWCRIAGGLELTGRCGPTGRFRQSRIARRLVDHACAVETEVASAPRDYQAFAGLSAFYDLDLWWMAAVGGDETHGRVVRLSWMDDARYGEGAMIPCPGDGPVGLRFTIWNHVLRFAVRIGDGPWRPLGEGIDAGRLSDETCSTGSNFTGAWASLSAHDLSGRGAVARFPRFAYRRLAAAPEHA
ncbi:MAG: hypothetical protein RLZZ127_1312 [Planctomycetota bacterium]|jgi:xylan 1,4-beta-xylosidase